MNREFGQHIGNYKLEKTNKQKMQETDAEIDNVERVTLKN